ncbi:hypothetical protein ACWC98_38785, partial [Streptomyces goshikiensis]
MSMESGVGIDRAGRCRRRRDRGIPNPLQIGHRYVEGAPASRSIMALLGKGIGFALNLPAVCGAI